MSPLLHDAHDVVVEVDAEFVKARVAGRLRRSDGTGIGSQDVKAAKLVGWRE